MTKKDSTTIAVIEDAEDVLDALKLILENQQWSTNLYSTGEEFIADFPKTKPDCVVLDPHLPNMSGVDVAQAIVATDDSIPIIVLTAQPNSPLTTKIRKMGAQQVLVKPIRAEALISSIENAL